MISSPGLKAGEVDDHVRALGRRHEQLVQHDGRVGQQAALGADLVEREWLVELQDQEARVAAVQEAEAVQARLDFQVGQVLPLTTMVSPKNSGFQMGDTSVSGQVGPGIAVKELAAVRVEQASRRVERAVLDRDRDLVVLGAGRIAQARAPGRAGSGCPRRHRGAARNQPARHRRSGA